MTDEDHGNFQPISIDIEAAIRQAEEAAYKRGYREGQEARNVELYNEAINDILERLRTKSEFNTGEYEVCLREIEGMKS